LSWLGAWLKIARFPKDKRPMPLLVTGINHKTAPVEIRERVVFTPESSGSALAALSALEGVECCALVSTCNRTEVYCQVIRPAAAVSVAEWFATVPGGSLDVRGFLYQHQDVDSVQHLLRVACGLDSVILGEPQILGQLKAAYQIAEQAGTLGRVLRRLFQHAFAVAKQVRTDTAIGQNPVSVAFAAVSLARQIFGDLSRHTALMIGAGDTIELAARHLKGNRIGEMIVANRNLQRAHSLASELGARAVGLAELPDILPQADITLTATASPLPILGKGAVERALKQRRHRPMLMVDIAVPRDIEPEVGDLADVYLYTVDDLGEVIEDNLRTRREAAAEAEAIVREQARVFMDWLRGQDAVTVIRSFRGRSEARRDEVLAKAHALLESGRPADEVLKFLAHTLTNKLIHEPTVALSQAAKHGRRPLLEAGIELLKLKDPES
jgi:glutamyl-tRNA reductase